MFLACQEKFNANLCSFFYSLPKKDDTFAHLLVRLVHLSCGAGSYTTRSFRLWTSLHSMLALFVRPWF